MYKVDLKYAELHNPLFLAGKNFGLKLDLDHISNLKLVYDREEKELLVHWQGKVGIIPSSNVACMVQVDELPKEEPVQQHPTQQLVRPSAQVESPQSHVFAGPGAGKTGK